MPLSLQRAQREWVSKEAIYMATLPFPLSWRCHDELRFQLTKLKYTQKRIDIIIHKIESFQRKHNFKSCAKRKRCYDVTSLWRIKQELGHLASGLECAGPAGGETQDVFFLAFGGTG